MIDYSITWEDVDGFQMPTIAHPNMPFEVKVEPSWVTFVYKKDSSGDTFFSIPSGDFQKLVAAINMMQIKMLENARESLDKASCKCAEHGNGCCNGDCHC